MKDIHRSLFSLILIILMISCIFSYNVDEDSPSISGKIGTEEVIEDQSSTDDTYLSGEGISRNNETYLDIFEGVTTLHETDSGNYTGIWVHGTGTLVLNGCKLSIGEGDDGHWGEFNVTEEGSIHILGGSEVYINKGNFSARGKEFRMEDSIITVENITGGQPGNPEGKGVDLDGEKGNDSVMAVVSDQAVVIKNSEIYAFGQTGGVGAAGINEQRMNGGHGGTGGKAEIIIKAPRVDITDGSIIKASGGKGGKGGERAPAFTSAKGGDGGIGGDSHLFIETKETITLKGSTFNSSAGPGGDASRTSGDELYGKGGRGGNTFTTFDAWMTIEFEDCFIYSLRGDEGYGGDRNVDGMWGKDDLVMEVQYNQISGLNSHIRISKDHFNVININPSGENVFDNVSIFSREWNREKPYGDNIIIKWPITVKVIDDHTKLGIPDSDVSIKVKNEFDEWESIRNGETDQKGYVRFYSITSRIMDEDNLGKDETVRINVMKYSYQDLRQLPLASPLNEIIFLKILALNIEEVSYRSVLVGDDKLTSVPLSSVRNGAPLGGIIYVNGSADISSQTETITEVSVAVEDGATTKVQDISDSNDWSKWSYKLDTVKKTGKDTKTKIQNIYDLMDLNLKFSAFETHGFTTDAVISLNVNQSRINNPPTAEITKIEGLDIIEGEDREIRLPPIKEKLVTIEGTFFDIDGDSISKANVWVSVMPTGEGKTIEQPVISDSKNTRIDQENGTWAVDWFLLYSNFPEDNYEMSVVISDGDLNSSDSDHFEAKISKMHIFLESNPKIVKVVANGIEVSQYEGGIEVKEGESMLFEVEASTDVGATIKKYMWTIMNTATSAIIPNGEVEKTSNKFSHTFIIPEDMEVKGDVELEVKVFVIDDRGYRSATKEFTVTVVYEPPEPETEGFLANVNLPTIIEVGDILFIALIVLYIAGFIFISTRTKKVRKKIKKRSEVAKKKTKVEQQKKIKSLAEIEGRGKDNVMYVPGGVGAQDYAPSGQAYGADIPPVGSYQDPHGQGAAFGAGPPAAAPSPQPAISTTTTPVSSPTIVTTTAPVIQPVTVPTTAPVTQPVSAPTTAPVTHPVSAPTTAPVTRPVTTPTTAPVTRPVTAPTTAPVTQPVTAPTTAPVTTTTAPPTMVPPTQPVAQPTGAAAPGKACPGCGSEIKPGWFICPKCKSIL